MQLSGGSPSPRFGPAGHRSLFLLGAGGHFLAAVAAIPFSVYVLGSDGLPLGAGWQLGHLAVVLMVVALGLHSLGFLGLWRNYHSRFGGVTFGVGRLAAILLLAAFLLASTSLGFVAASTLSMVLVIDGVAYVDDRHTLLQPLCTATAALLLVSGLLVGAVFLAPVRGIIAVPAFALGGIVLLTAPMPVAAPIHAAHRPT